MGFIDTLKDEAAVLKAAPLSVAAIIVATSAATIFVAQWVYGARFDAMEEQLRLKDAQLAQYSPAPVVPASPSSTAPSSSEASSPFDPVADADKLQSSKSAWTRAFKQPSEPPAEPPPNPIKPDPSVIYK